MVNLRFHSETEDFTLYNMYDAIASTTCEIDETGVYDVIVARTKPSYANFTIKTFTHEDGIKKKSKFNFIG